MVGAAIVMVAALWPWLDDRPPLSDVDLFPPKHVCQQMIEINRQYHTRIQERIESGMETHNHAALLVLQAEARYLGECWDWAFASRGGYHHWCQRDALRHLQRLLGDQAYSTGLLPPCVPLWRFQER